MIYLKLAITSIFFLISLITFSGNIFKYSRREKLNAMGRGIQNLNTHTHTIHVRHGNRVQENLKNKSNFSDLDYKGKGNFFSLISERKHDK